MVAENSLRGSESKESLIHSRPSSQVTVKCDAHQSALKIGGLRTAKTMFNSIAWQVFSSGRNARQFSKAIEKRFAKQ